MKSKPVRFIEDSMRHETELLYVVILVIFILGHRSDHVPDGRQAEGQFSQLASRAQSVVLPRKKHETFESENNLAISPRSTTLLAKPVIL
jgi:hypothetical protein